MGAEAQAAHSFGKEARLVLGRRQRFPNLDEVCKSAYKDIDIFSVIDVAIGDVGIAATLQGSAQ